MHRHRTRPKALTEGVEECGGVTRSWGGRVELARDAGDADPLEGGIVLVLFAEPHQGRYARGREDLGVRARGIEVQRIYAGGTLWIVVVICRRIVEPPNEGEFPRDNEMYGEIV